MGANYSTLFLIFFIYAVIGYIVETISVSVIEKELIFSRGFLIGPYLPLFGFGGLFMTVTLWKYRNDLVALFIMSMAICLVLEYLSSYILEKIFKLRWWDYSDKRFNLNGRVCLEVGLMFGFSGILLVKFINPFIFKIFGLISPKLLVFISIFLTIILLTDIYLSTKTILKLEKNFVRYTNDTSLEMKALIIEDLSKNSFFIKRLLSAFPSADNKLSQFRELKILIYEKIMRKKLKKENK